jgi:hypothetical protein
MYRGSGGSDWADGDGIFLQHNRLELDGSYRSN